MTPPPVPPGFPERLLAITEQLGEGAPTQQVLTSVVEAAVDFTGAQAGLVTKIERGQQHILATTRTIASAIGRSYDHSGSMLDRLLGSDVPVAEVPAEELPPPVTEALAGRGWRRLAACRGGTGGPIPVGVYLFLAAPGPPLRFDQLTLLRTLTGIASSAVAGDRVRAEGRLLVATMSHELRTPLTVVKGFAETLQNRWSELGEAERLAAVEVIGQRTADISELLDRLMLGVHADADTVAVHSAPYDLVAALNELAVGVAHLAPAHPLRLEVPAALPPVFGDRAMLDVVVGELLTNAAKYSPPGAEILLAAGVADRLAWVRVSDRGVGIDPAHVEHAFARFWQADRSDVRRFGGVGLGLHLVRRLVEAQGGWATVRPRAGGGTAAEIRLPLAADPR